MSSLTPLTKLLELLLVWRPHSRKWWMHKTMYVRHPRKRSRRLETRIKAWLRAKFLFPFLSFISLYLCALFSSFLFIWFPCTFATDDFLSSCFYLYFLLFLLFFYWNLIHGMIKNFIFLLMKNYLFWVKAKVLVF